MLSGLGKSGQKPKAAALYASTVSRAREPVFFTEGGVADSVDGRFDLVVLHAFLVLEALEHGGTEARALAGDFTDVVFAGFEDALREMGVGDFGLSRRIKAMANAFYGRLEAYRAAASEAEMAEALLRNLYRGAAHARGEACAMARYVDTARAHLARKDSAAALLLGSAAFGPLPILSAP